MPGPVLHVNAVVLCSHGGQVRPTAPNPRVTVSGQPIVTLPAPWAVVGCALPPPPAANGPCVTAQWITSAVRVTSMGQPLLLFDSQATCVPTGTPVIVTGAQMRVTGM